MLRLSRLHSLVILLAATMAVTACTPKATTTGSRPTQTQTPEGRVDLAKPVRIAVLAPTSATNPGAAALGQALVNSARMAAVDLNDPTMELAVYDTAGDAATANAVAKRAIAEGARLIVGPLFGANAKAIAATAAGANVSVLSFSTDSTAAGGPIYLSGFLPEKAAGRISSFARAQGYSTLGIFYPETPYGQVTLRGATATNGANLVAVTGYERSETGIPPAAKAFADQIRSTGVRAFMVAESGQALTFVADQLNGQGLSRQSYRYLGLGEWNAAATLQSDVLNGAWFPAPDPAAMRRFVDKYKASFGGAPSPLAVLGYDAVQVAGQLLAEARASGSTDPFNVAALTRPSGFRGAVGPLRFDRNGLGERGMAILEVRDGQFRTIDPAPPAFGAGS